MKLKTEILATETKSVPDPKKVSLNAAIAVAALKGRLIDQWNKPNTPVYSRDFLNRAGDEAAAIAWSTGFPLLLFPSLFEEKAREARFKAFRQNEIRAKSPQWAAMFTTSHDTPLLEVDEVTE